MFLPSTAQPRLCHGSRMCRAECTGKAEWRQHALLSMPLQLAGHYHQAASFTPMVLCYRQNTSGDELVACPEQRQQGGQWASNLLEPALWMSLEVTSKLTMAVALLWMSRYAVLALLSLPTRPVILWVVGVCFFFFSVCVSVFEFF